MNKNASGNNETCTMWTGSRGNGFKRNEHRELTAETAPKSHYKSLIMNKCMNKPTN